MGNREVLNGGRSTRRDGVRNTGRNKVNGGRAFQTVGNRHHGGTGGFRGYGGACGITNRADVRRRWARNQIRAKMELRRKEHHGEQQGQNAKARTVKAHVLYMKKLRQEWLPGQVI